MRINEQRLQFVFNSPTGPVGQFLGRTGVRAESTAKILITQERLVRSGRYRSSIAWRLINDGRGLFLQFGSALDIARLIERGSPAHAIRPSRKKALFWQHGADRGWVVPGHPVAAVSHPGTEATWILHRALEAVLRR